jgi:membrane protein
MANRARTPSASRAAEKIERRVSPWKLGGLSARELARRVWTEAWADEIIDRAAGLSYYFIFALFPALLFLTSLLGLLPIPNLMDRLMGYVQEALPGDAGSLIQKTLAEIVAGARGGLVSIGALAALWAASAGVASMMTALNVAYDVEDTRPWWKRRLLAIGLTFALALMILTAMTLLVFGGAIGRFLGNFVGLGDFAVKVWNVAQWPVAALFVVGSIALVYYVAPAVEHRKWYWVTPGSLVATVAWLAMSIGLRAYVNYFGNYTATYGSIAGVILLMLWLYLSGLVLLLGAEINSEIEHAAAERGAPSAKAEGERAPGVPGPPPRAVERAVKTEAAQERAATVRAGHPPDDRDREPFTMRATDSVAPAAAGTVHLVRAAPWIAAWAGCWVVARVTRVFARGGLDRSDRLARAERAAVMAASERLERARAAERARHQMPPLREAG